MHKGLHKMTDQEHLRILDQGVKAFNEWREDNLGIEPNLIKANLSGANLKGVNLSCTNLSRSDNSGVNIAGCLIAQKN